MGLELFLTDGYFFRVLVTGLLVAALAGALGVFLVLRHLSLFGNAVANTSFLGVAIAFQAGWNPFATAIAASILGATAMDALRRRKVLASDAALAVVLTGALAIALVVSMQGGRVPADVQTFLFGYFLLVTEQDLLTLLASVVVLGVLLLVYHRAFVAMTFDEEALAVQGVETRWLGLAFHIILAIAVVVASRVVGVLLVSALLIMPAAAALQFARSFNQALLLSVGLAMASVLVGLSVAADFALPTGAAVAVASLAILLAALWLRRALDDRARRKQRRVEKQYTTIE